MSLIEVIRQYLFEDATLGVIRVDGANLGYTCEDRVRAVKVYGQTAIPAGHYAVRMRVSPTWRRTMPYICGVRGFTNVMLHAGNDAGDTLGCILVGRQIDIERRCILQSRLCLQDLLDELSHSDSHEISISESPIVDERKQ
jgi:hypothetical protein